MRRLTLLISFVVLLAGCTTKPVYNVDKEQIPNPSRTRLSLNDVERAILSAAQKRGWSARVIKPGLIEANLALRSHRAAVEIPYSQSDYSINYKSSENLDYEDGNIHRNYNNWIIRLSRDINSELGMAAQKN